MHTRQAAAFAAVEATGLTKSEVARIAGAHRSQVSRWASGEQRPSYERTMRLAAHLRRGGHLDVAEELVAACGYGPSGGPESGPLLPGHVTEALESAYRGDPDHLRKMVEALEAIERERRAAGQSPSGRRAG